MKIEVKVITKAGRNALELTGENRYKVWVTAAPDKGKANQAVTKLLAKELDVPITSISLVQGATSTAKIFSVD